MRRQIFACSIKIKSVDQRSWSPVIIFCHWYFNPSLDVGLFWKDGLKNGKKKRWPWFCLIGSGQEIDYYRKQKALLTDSTVACAVQPKVCVLNQRYDHSAHGDQLRNQSIFKEAWGLAWCPSLPLLFGFSSTTPFPGARCVNFRQEWVHVTFLVLSGPLCLDPGYPSVLHSVPISRGLSHSLKVDYN